jgi:hypothetical protein
MLRDEIEKQIKKMTNNNNNKWGSNWIQRLNKINDEG